MAGAPSADSTNVTRTRLRRGLAAIVITVTLLIGAAPATLADQIPSSTTSPTTAPAGAAPSTGDAVPPASSTVSTSPPAPGDVPATPLPPATPGPPPPEDEAPVPTSIPPLAPVGSDEAGRIRAQAELATAQRALRTAQATQRRSERAVAPLRQRLEQADDRVALLSLADGRAAADLVAARDRMKRLAVAGYVTGSAAPVDYLLRARDPQDLARRNTLVRSATEARKQAVDGFDAARRGVSRQLDEAIAARDDAAAAFEQADAQLSSDSAVVQLLQADIENKRLLLDLVTAAAPVAPSDIPRLFLDAYRSAAATMWRRSPACRVPWTALAALGRIESNHGRYRDSQLALNGDVWPRVLGIPLDGTRSATIPDSDLGLLDGDPVWDRAVGPMQFIPSTWARIGIDGNGDGNADPNNAYDAALSAALYLCRAAPQGNLDTDEAALRQAFFSYNHSDAYVELAVATKAGYDAMAASLPADPLPR